MEMMIFGTNLLHCHQKEITPCLGKHSQSKIGRMFKHLANLTDDDAASAEMQDVDNLADWMDKDKN